MIVADQTLQVEKNDTRQSEAEGIIPGVVF
jgi:hypothetical protein